MEQQTFGLDDDTTDEDTWEEVSQAVFLSWSEARQLSYCAARDENAILFCDHLDEALWFQWRAEKYRRMLDGELKRSSHT